MNITDKLRERAEYIENNFHFLVDDAVLMYKAANLIDSMEKESNQKGVYFAPYIKSYHFDGEST